MRVFSDTFQSCITDYENHGQDRAADHNPPLFGETVTSYVRCSAEFVDRFKEAIGALATLIIAAFTGTLWVATSRQAKITETAFIADKRAFVFPKDVFTEWFPAENGQYAWRFKPIWENSGDTPTKKLRIYTDCELRNSVLPKDFDFTKIKNPYGTGFAGPRSTYLGGSAPTAPAAPISAQDVKDTQEGKKFIYLWGWASYFDVFPHTKEHITRFCWLIVPIGDPFAFNPEKFGQPGGMRFPPQHHTHGNEADDESIPQPL